MIKLCVVCGRVFDARGSAITCSSNCGKDRQKARYRTQKYKARYRTQKYKARYRTQKYKDYTIARQKTKRWKDYHKAYNRQTRKDKTWNKGRMRAYRLLHPATQNFFKLIELTKTLKQYENDQTAQLLNND